MLVAACSSLILLRSGYISTIKLSRLQSKFFLSTLLSHSSHAQAEAIAKSTPSVLSLSDIQHIECTDSIFELPKGCDQLIDLQAESKVSHFNFLRCLIPRCTYPNFSPNLRRISSCRRRERLAALWNRW